MLLKRLALRITDTLVQGLVSVIRVVSFIEELLTTFHVPCSKFFANISYKGRVNMSQGYT